MNRQSPFNNRQRFNNQGHQINNDLRLSGINANATPLTISFLGYANHDPELFRPLTVPGEKKKTAEERREEKASLAEKRERMARQFDESFANWVRADDTRKQAVADAYNRAFRGRDQVGKNWSALLSSVPDFRSELLRTANEGDTGWAEWHWFGTRTDGTRFEMCGVTIFGFKNDRITWQRLYMEEVEEAGAGIDATVRSLTHEPPQEG